MTALTECFIEYLEYRAALAQVAPDVRPLTYADWLEFFNLWNVKE